MHALAYGCGVPAPLLSRRVSAGSSSGDECDAERPDSTGEDWGSGRETERVSARASVRASESESERERDGEIDGKRKKDGERE